MNIYWLILFLAVTLAALLLGTHIVNVVRDVKVARFTGVDPRLDEALRKDALRQLKEQGK